MIGPDEIHVWALEPVRTSPGSVASVLDDAERAARNRLRLPLHRESYDLRHSMLRRVLSWCQPAVPPRQWRFATGPWGRPEIESPDTGCRLRFNLSHTHRWMALVVTVNRACGVDIEDERRPLDTDHLSRMALSDRERLEVRAVSPADQKRELLRRWTVKEAYLKGRGVGLDVPLPAVGTARTPTGPRLVPGPHTPDAGQWQLRQWIEANHLVVTVAVRAAPGSVLTLHQHHAPPDTGNPVNAPTQEGLEPCTT